ncbi:AfsR/SARP family transcriptional regulator [Blastococcus sp. SYSU D00813]
MSVLVLGPLEVWRDGRLLPVRRGRPRRLLLSLLLQRGGAVAPETLIDRLWGDEPPANADNALQVLVSYLRRSIGGPGLGIERGTAGYRLRVDPDDVDMTRFEALVREAAAADPAGRLAAATAALALWRGPALSEAADDPFAQGDVARLEELRLQADELRAAALLDLGRHGDALPDLGQLVRAHPFRERLHGQYALALYRSGRQADALQVLDRARTALAEQLGLDPGPELQELAGRILRQDPGLAAAPPASPPAPPLPSPEASPAPVPAGVPAVLTPLIGREAELAGVRSALAGHRLVTLTGPGGAGKTRLAIEAGEGSAGPVWWADLAPVTDAAGVAAVVATAVGTALATDEDPAGVLARWIGDRRALLVLDTCERVPEHVARLVLTLAPRCPGLRVLVTSRRPLGVPGELAWPVPPLPVPGAGAGFEEAAAAPAVRLFVDRAARARPGFALTPANAADVAAVCRLLDGLPLAVELAAGHAAALSPGKTAALLTDRLRLAGDGGARPARHADLRATVDWSVGLLTADEGAFLDRLSVFAGPFPVEAAVEVAGPGLGTDGLQLLLGLVRQSLVTATDDDRFRLLDTIRAYAAERLAGRPADLRAARDRHARWHAQFAEEADRALRGAVAQAGWLADLRVAAPDLRAALQHCLGPEGDQRALGARLAWSLAWFWSFEGAFAEARGWLAAALAAGPHEPRLEARLHLAAGMHAESLGDLGTAQRECGTALAAFAELGDVRGQARCLLHLGTVHWARGRLREAADAQDRAVALFRTEGHDSGAGLGLVQRARTALEQGDAEAAEQLLADARHVLDRTGDEHLVALCREQLARTCLALGRPAEAAVLARDCAAAFAAIGYPEGVVAATLTLGRAALATGDDGAARTAALTAVRRARDLSHAPATAEGLELLAAALAAGDPAAAAGLLGCADAVRARDRVPRTPTQEDAVGRTAAGLAGALGDGYAAAVAAGGTASPEVLLAAAGGRVRATTVG